MLLKRLIILKIDVLEVLLAWVGCCYLYNMLYLCTPIISKIISAARQSVIFGRIIVCSVEELINF